MSSPGPPAPRRHLVALPRRHPAGGVVPLSCAVHRHLVAISRHRPILALEEGALPSHRERRPLTAVILSLCLLALVCCGGVAGLTTLVGDRDAAPDPAPAPSSSGDAPAAEPIPPGTPKGVRIGRRCTPSGTLGRTTEDLLVICGPDRYGRDRWRPLTPAAFRLLTGRPIGG